MPFLARRMRLICLLLLGGASFVMGGCAPAPVTEIDAGEAQREIERLETRLDAQPGDVGVLRDLGTLYVLTDRTERGQALLLKAFEVDANDPKTIFYLGLASERTGRLDQALRLYQGYADVNAASPYRTAIQGRHDLVLRRLVEREAKRDVSRCLQQGQCAAASETTVAVLPLRYQGGDERFATLGLGIAELVSIDLASVRTLTVVERVRLQAVINEIERSQGPGFRSDVGPRTGRLIGAGQLVGGAFTVGDGRDLRLSTRLSSVNGQARDLSTESAELQRLFRVQKSLVFGIVDALGIELTPAEREAIQFVPTESLQAFLAFSRGLDAEDRGEYLRAAREFRRAREIDPGFTAAASRESRAEALSDASAGALPTPVVTASLDLVDLRLSNMASTGGVLSSDDGRDADGEWSGVGGTFEPSSLPLPPEPTTGSN